MKKHPYSVFSTNKPKQQQQQLTPTTTTISNINQTSNFQERRRIEEGQNHLTYGNSQGYLRRFHGMDDAKEIWEAIRTRLEKGYDRFQQLFSQLEAHGAEVSTEDVNHKFLRSLPPAWSNLAMTMRTKPDVDTLSIDDLYNNLRVFEQELISTSKSSVSAQNVAFVSHSKSSTNKVKSGHTCAYSTYTPTSSNNIQEKGRSCRINVTTGRTKQPVPTCNSFSTKRPQDHPLEEHRDRADEDEELIVVPIAIKHSAGKVRQGSLLQNSREEKMISSLALLERQISNEFYGFDLASVKTAITLMETKMALTKDEEADEVDVTPKTSHVNAVKRIFKYLKGKPNLGLWYPRESSFDLEAYSDSNYVGANLDRKSTTDSCQYLGSRIISWQCKKQTIVATSTTEAEYVAAASCCGQVLWIQNQMLDYGFNFMNTKIHIDNESTICIVKNPVYHSKTKHIEIRHHFIRDSYEKKLIRVEKIHTDFNVADLLTKAFDGPRLYLDCIGAWIKVELKL
ncbi:hypothetical protein Tco_1211436 [Tanacetum coccineum]